MIGDHDQPYAASIAGPWTLADVTPTTITVQFPMSERTRGDVEELVEIDRFRSWLRFNERRHANPFPRFRPFRWLP